MCVITWGRKTQLPNMCEDDSGGQRRGRGRQSADKMPCLVHSMGEENTTLLPNGWRHLSGVIKERHQSGRCTRILRQSLDFKTTGGASVSTPGRNLTRLRFSKALFQLLPKVMCVNQIPVRGSNKRKLGGCINAGEKMPDKTIANFIPSRIAPL